MICLEEVQIWIFKDISGSFQNDGHVFSGVTKTSFTQIWQTYIGQKVATVCVVDSREIDTPSLIIFKYWQYTPTHKSYKIGPNVNIQVNTTRNKIKEYEAFCYCHEVWESWNVPIKPWYVQKKRKRQKVKRSLPNQANALNWLPIWPWLHFNFKTDKMSEGGLTTTNYR